MPPKEKRGDSQPETVDESSMARATEKKPSPQAKAPWRRVALCTKGCSVYLGGMLSKVFGGEWITDAMQAKSLDRDKDHFLMVDVDSPDHLSELMAAHKKTIDALKAEAKKLGLVVFRDGEAIPVKR